MKKEPCIRLGMRISPKIREKPEDSRKSSPPRARLLMARMAAWAAVSCVIMNGLSPAPRNATRLDNHHARKPGITLMDPGLADLPHHRRTAAAIPETSPADRHVRRPYRPGSASRRRS